MYKDSKEKRKIVKEFLIKNPNATTRDIRKKLNIKLERLYTNGLKEAFIEAGINPKRNIERKNKDEQKKIIIQYIKNNPFTTTQEIRKKLKINVCNFFNSIPEAYKEANIKYPRREIDKRTKEEKILTLKKLVKENPTITITEIEEKTHIKPYSFFKSIKDIYNLSNINYLGKGSKRKVKKRIEVLNFIKNNPIATQREINQRCKTHIQGLFAGGIFEAYKEAKIDFPFERLKLHGATLKEIKLRAKSLEEKIAEKLTGYGNVTRLVKTKRGFADIILERKNKKTIIEVKDYQSKEISLSEIKQLNKYLEDCDCHLGFLICNQKPKKDSFLMGKNKIIILDYNNLNDLVKIMDVAVG